MDEIIKTDLLSKNYGQVRAVDGVSLSVKKGEIYGFLGLNGAGKTTTIRMLLGMVRPVSGSSYLFGKRVNPGNRELWNRVGYLVEVPYSYPDLTVRENLEIIRRLRFIKDKNTVGTVIDKLQIDPYRDMKAKNLSHGNAQRLGLAKALMHDPEILILDEPSNGLDPVGIVEIRDLLLNLAAHKGTTVFVSSHILGEISKLATRIGIIHHGRLVNEAAADQLESLRLKRLRIKANDMVALKKKLSNEGFSFQATDDGGVAIKSASAIGHPDEIAKILVKDGVPPTMLIVEEEDLESYFLRIIGMSRETG
jgi:ABC-2 type transport system ATP-binding protein